MLTTTDAAKLLNVSPVTIRTWIKRGYIKRTKFGRDTAIDENELQRFAQVRRRAGRPKKQTEKKASK